MKNALVFFYNIYVPDLKKINNDYYFFYQNNNYGVFLYDRSINEIQEIYDLNLEMLNYQIPVYQIKTTKDNNIFITYEGNYYILMQLPNIHNRIITFDDILIFNFASQKSYKMLDKSNWSNSWSNKIDYIITKVVV